MTMATPSKSRVQLPPHLTQVEDLLLWHNVPKSATVLSAATALYILLEWSGVPLLTWLSNIGLIAVLLCTLWAAGARFMGMTGPADQLPSVLRTGLDETSVRSIAEKVRVVTNKGLALINRLLSGEDLILAGKALVVLYATGTLGRIITPVGLLYTVILGLFTLPKLYEMRKDEIDGAVDRARVAAEQQYTATRTKATELINRLTPQKGARPAASDISSGFKDE
eukprot:GHRR01000740.1.p1 GENE.GHRR01000740.1~~GHRR01000740.1.p1  ORF type:complete len:224 (+),score=66.58 GHRR01000740.1:244-915(+)